MSEFVSRYSLLLHDLRVFVEGLREVGLKDDASALEEIVSGAPHIDLAQQPAAVDGESVIIDGRRYGLDTVRTALLGLAADVVRDAALAGQPGGSDNDR